jgi:aldehyde dehydrogenase (NAD+)
VAQELGGNCPNILLDDVDLQAAVTAGVQACLSNAGQSCNSPQRMLLPHARMNQAAEIAKIAAEAERPGPVASLRHFAKVQELIALGLQGGARLVTGGPGRPDGVSRGWHVRPTIFADVTMDMAIARTEVFGPVLQMIGYRDENDAVAIANDTEYGLAAYVQSASRARALSVAKRLRAGWVEINHAPFDYAAPFGGYRRSGNGREYGAFGLAEYLEVKAVMGA